MRRVALAAALCGAASGVAATPLNAALEACLHEQAKRLPFNGVVSAGKAQTRFEHRSGFADALGQRPLSRDTPFRLASVGKLFTRAAVARLLQAGLVRLDDSVRRHLPELPAAFEAVTLRQLLEHRGGVASMTRPDMADAPAMAAAQSARDLVAVVAAKPLDFEPGKRQAYSNGGYLLLGAVVEAVSGVRFPDFVAQQIFEPLGMKSSGFEPGPHAAVPLTRLVGPGQAPSDKPRARMEFAALKASSAGDALSSLADLEAFAQALVGEALFTDAIKADVFPRTASPWRLGQAGGTVGSNTGFWVFPEEKSWLIVLSNFDPPAGELMGQALLPVLTGQACKPADAEGLRMMSPPPGGVPQRP